MALDKDRIHELVGIFYQPPFKTFYINSTDGQNFEKPTGVFVSFGITTSWEKMKEIQDALDRTPGIKTEFVEIESVKVGGQYMNHIISRSPKQYETTPDSVRPCVVLDEEESSAELQKLIDSPDRENYVKLKDAITRIQESDAPWVNQKVMRLESGGYRVFHRFTNYKKEGEHEFRLGIYVEESN